MMITSFLMAFSLLFMTPQARQNNDVSIISDKVENGIREIVAIPSSEVCSVKMVIKVEQATEIVRSVVYTGGCDGNLKAVNALVSGLTVRQVIDKLSGITCGRKKTSCTDQLARALKKAYGK